MAKQDTKELIKFLKAFPEDIQQNALWLREFVWDLYPKSNELIYDNYNALAVGWSPTNKSSDAFCTFAVYGGGINFGFNRGSEIKDPKKILAGNGKLYRYLKVLDVTEFPKSYIKRLLKEAYVNSKARLKKDKTILKGKTIVKMTLEKKRRPIL
ncbi:MAG TPA: DUF1801 domain-containing protein [Ignavibacteria bacterium]|jgi:hypothetical protein